MTRNLTIALAGTALVASLGLWPAAAYAEAADARSLLESARAAYSKRASPPESEKALQLYDRAIQAGGGYAALWEGARAAADRGSNRMGSAGREAKRDVFKRGVDWAKRAIKMRPRGAEGHLYLAISLGQHASSQTFFHQMGAAGGIRQAAEKAVELNPNAECGTPLRVLGLYYLRLPGAFGGDDKQALKLLRQGVRACPDEPDAHMDYAEALVANGQRAKAVEELDWVLAHPPERAADRVGYRRTKAQALKMLKKLE